MELIPDTNPKKIKITNCKVLKLYWKPVDPKALLCLAVTSTMAPSIMTSVEILSTTNGEIRSPMEITKSLSSNLNKITPINQLQIFLNFQNVLYLMDVTKCYFIRTWVRTETKLILRLELTPGWIDNCHMIKEITKLLIEYEKSRS